MPYQNARRTWPVGIYSMGPNFSSRWVSAPEGCAEARVPVPVRPLFLSVESPGPEIRQREIVITCVRKVIRSHALSRTLPSHCSIAYCIACLLFVRLWGGRDIQSGQRCVHRTVIGVDHRVVLEDQECVVPAQCSQRPVRPSSLPLTSSSSLCENMRPRPF